MQSQVVPISPSIGSEAVGVARSRRFTNGELTRERDKLRVQLSNAQLVIEVQKNCRVVGATRTAFEVCESLEAGTYELAPALGSAAACRAMGLWRGAPARHQARAHRTAFVGPPPVPRPVRPRSPLALSEAEQSLVLQALCSERFCDTAPAAVHATLLDEGSYLGSVRTMYSLKQLRMYSVSPSTVTHTPMRMS